MKNNRQQTGRRGETEGCNYLTAHGYTIIDRNWRSSHLELDIVALAPDGLHFVEVKTRNAPTTAEPEENVDRRKRERLTRAARAYLNQKCLMTGLGNTEVFFDVLTVVLDGELAQIEYYPQAFIPTYV